MTDTMKEFISNNFIKYHSIYHKILYIVVLLLTIVLRALKIVENTELTVAIGVTLIVFSLLDSIAFKYNYWDSVKIFMTLKYTELFAYAIIQAFISDEGILFAVMLILVMLLSVEFVIHGSEYEKSVVFSRKMMLIGPVTLNLIISVGTKTESVWFCYFLLQFISVLIVYFISDWFVAINSAYESINRKISLEKSNVENINEKLLEYQNRVKSINEKINYQKIDLKRAMNELEQANTEIESQTEVMKYMASTFDVPKCINVITDAIMDVKRPKLCALYIDKDVYMNKFESYVIKSNYTSMQRRLRKDIESIYLDVVENRREAQIIKDDVLKDYRFIGDANINSLAILPLGDTKEKYGIMIVGSDDREFF